MNPPVHKALTTKWRRLRTGPTGTALMIIEGIVYQLVVQVHGLILRAPVASGLKRAGLGSRSRSAYGVDLFGGQHIEHGRAGDKVSIARAVGQEPPERRFSTLPSMIIVSSGSGGDRLLSRIASQDESNAAQTEGAVHPTSVGCTRPGAEVDDLQYAAETLAVDQIVDQLGEVPGVAAQAEVSAAARAASRLGRRRIVLAIQVGEHACAVSLPRAGYLVGPAPLAAKRAAASVR